MAPLKLYLLLLVSVLPTFRRLNLHRRTDLSMQGHSVKLTSTLTLLGALDLTE